MEIDLRDARIETRIEITKAHAAPSAEGVLMPIESKPLVIVVAGPNGASKSTVAPYLLRDTLAVREFVNADTIASGLSAFRPESEAVAASRVMHTRVRALGTACEHFAFETTLASHSCAHRVIAVAFAPWLRDLQRTGYHVHLLFLWPRSADLAVIRVAERVKRGGHDIPAEVIRRRYGAGLENFFRSYLPLVDGWQMFDNSERSGPRRIAEGARDDMRVFDSTTWKRLMESSHG